MYDIEYNKYSWMFPLYTNRTVLYRSKGGKIMEFNIRIRSFQEVQDFIKLATVQPFRVLLGNDFQSANATSFMGVVSLDHSHPLRVSADCGEEEFASFRNLASRFLAE